jgi:hypothetical protein
MRQIVILGVLLLTLFLLSCDEMMTEGDGPYYYTDSDSLFVCNFDGSGKYALPYVNSYYNLFSPDGKKVISIFSDSILTYDIDTNSLSVFHTPHLLFPGVSRPNSIPQGSNIVCFDTMDCDIYTFDYISGILSNITNTPNIKETNPIQHGNNIWFAEYHRGLNLSNFGKYDLTSCTVDTVFSDDNLFTDLLVSNCGKYLFFTKFNIAGIFRVNSDGTGILHFTIGSRGPYDNVNLLVTPRYKDILMSDNHTSHGCDLFDYDGNHLKNIPDAAQCCITDDGTQIYYSTSRDIDNSRIYRFSLEDNTAHLIGSGCQVSVSSDGSRILYNR